MTTQNTPRTPEQTAWDIDRISEVSMRRSAQIFMDTELGGEFHSNSVKVTPDSFSAVVATSFIYKNIEFKRGARLKMDRDGNIIGALFS
jgi:hypothetical protein